MTEGSTALSVRGKVDRVDGWIKDGKLYLRVVDYKTGQKAFDLSDVRYGLGIQMLLYLFALQKEGSRIFRDAGGAGRRAVYAGAGDHLAGGPQHPARRSWRPCCGGSCGVPACC